MTHTTFVDEIRMLINRYPDLRGEIMDFYDLCQDEINQGGSPEHERELAINSIDDLVKEHNKID